MGDGRISMKVAPEVSELDYTNVVQIQGFTIPAITSRRASTTVELADGQSFAIAGLLRDDVRQAVNKYPVLGDMPVLGTLFRSSNWQKNETELVIIVTPHLAKPLEANATRLPTDAYREPSAFEYFILGRMEGSRRADATAAAARTYGTTGAGAPSGMEGAFGHMLPAR